MSYTAPAFTCCSNMRYISDQRPMKTYLSLSLTLSLSVSPCFDNQPDNSSRILAKPTDVSSIEARRSPNTHPLLLARLFTSVSTAAERHLCLSCSGGATASCPFYGQSLMSQGTSRAENERLTCIQVPDMLCNLATYHQASHPPKSSPGALPSCQLVAKKRPRRLAHSTASALL